MVDWLRGVRQGGTNGQKSFEISEGGLGGDELAAVRAHFQLPPTAPAAGREVVDQALIVADVGPAMAASGGEPGSPGLAQITQTGSQPTELGFGRNPYFVTSANLAAIGANTVVDAWDKLQYGLAEIYIESQMALGGVSAAARGAALASFASLNGAARIAGGYVAIDAFAASGDGAALLEALEALGLERGAAFGRIAGGLMPLDMLDELAGLDLLGFARPVYAETRAGSITSQNVVSMNGDYLQSLGLDGTGLTIGILSDSFDTATITTQGGALTVHYADDIASWDLPGGITVLADFTSPSVKDEGRAMAQLVHDMAPGANLMFHTAFVSQADFAIGIMDLVNAGADIVVDDVIWFAEPFFQDGVIAQAVDAATAAGAMYFSAAMNFGSVSYSSEFRHSGQFITLADGVTYEFHDFDPGAGIDTRQGFTTNGPVTYVLNWDQPNFSVSGGAGAQSNMAWLLRDSGGAESYTGTNNIGRDAIEIAHTTPSDVTEIALLLRVGDPAPGRIQYVLSGYTDGVTIDEWATNSGTAFGHSNAATALSVAAVDWADSMRFAGAHDSAALTGGSPFPFLESYSSRGDIPILFDIAGNRLAAPEWRSSVDFAAGDGGNTTFFGPDVDYDADSLGNFFGTSAAAPNAAAAAALLMQAFPSATRTQIETALKHSAIDIRYIETNGEIGVGYDNISGHGLIQADRAYHLLAAMLDPATALAKGEVAPVSYETAGGSAALRFVLLDDVPVLTTIYISDRAWSGSAFAAPTAGEGTYAWVAGLPVAAGTVITLDAAELATGGVVLDAAGDTLYFYQGGQDLPTRFLFAADIADGNATFDGSLANTGLVDASNAVAVAYDHALWQGAATGLAATTLGSIADSANWFDLSGAPSMALNTGSTVAVTSSSATYTESTSAPGSPAGPPVAPFTGATITDPGHTTLEGAQVAITTGFVGGDTLSFTNTGGITGSYDSTTGVVTFTGTGTFAEYQAVLNSIRFANAGDNPTGYGSATGRVLSMNVFDGTLWGTLGTVSLTVVGINDAPVNTVGGTIAANEDQGKVVTGLSVSDPDADPATQDVTVTLSVLHGTIAIFTNAGNGVVLADVTGNGTSTVTITATQNQLNATFAAANGVTYTPSAPWTADTLTITTNDGGFNGNDPGLTGSGTSEQDQDTQSITIAAVNDKPGSTNLSGDLATWTEGDSAILLDVGADATIADIDSADFAGGTLTVHINDGLAAEDQLGIDTTGTVTLAGSAVSVGGVQIATVSGGGAGASDLVFTFDPDATPAAVQALIRAITYANTGGDNPTEGVSFVVWTLVDGDGTANGGADTLILGSRVEIVDLDDAASIIGDVAGDVTEAGGVNNGTPGTAEATGDLDATDVDDTADAWQAEFAGAPTSNGYGTYALTAAGVWTYSLDDSNPAVEALKGAATLTDTFTVLTEGGTAQLVTITIHAQNDAPILTVQETTASGTEDLDLVFSAANSNAISVDDLDDATLEVALTVLNGVLTLSQTTGLTFTTGDGTGDATMLFTGTAADINAALEGLTYRGVLNYEGADTLAVGVTDTATLLTQDIAITLADDGKINGDSGENVQSGTAGPDSFRLEQGGNDTANGGDGNDGFYFGAAFNSKDTVDGGDGDNDQIGLQGNYTGLNALALGASTITDVEVIAVLKGFDYDITTVDANVPAGGRLTIFGGNLGPDDNLTFNGSAESTGSFKIYGGQGIDLITTGGGNDGIYFGPNKFNPANDRVNGGTGINDQLALDGDYAITLDGTAIQNIDVIALLKGIPGDLADYNLTLDASLLGLGQELTIWGMQLETELTVDGSAVVGDLRLYGATASDRLTGGTGNDWFWGGADADFLTGGDGVDTFRYESVAQSHATGFEFDRLIDFDDSVDRIDLPTGVSISGFASATTALANAANLSADLEGANSLLGLGQAVVFTANGGDMDGRSFLLIDANGMAGYQATGDFLIELVNPTTPIDQVGMFI